MSHRKTLKLKLFKYVNQNNTASPHIAIVSPLPHTSEHSAKYVFGNGSSYHSGTDVWVLPNSYIEALSPSATVCGNEAFGR